MGCILHTIIAQVRELVYQLACQYRDVKKHTIYFFPLFYQISSMATECLKVKLYPKSVLLCNMRSVEVVEFFFLMCILRSSYCLVS